MGKDPIAKINLEKKQAHVDFVTRYKDGEPSSPCTSKSASMKELPSYIEENGNNREFLRVPSQYHLSLMVRDIANLQRLMSTSIKVALSLASLKGQAKIMA